MLGGFFTKIGNDSHNFLAKLDPKTGLANQNFQGDANVSVGAIGIDNARNIEYNPKPGFNGIDTFNYTVTDGTKTSTAEVKVIVNQSPNLDDSVSPNLTGIGLNDTENNGTSITELINGLGGNKITDPDEKAKQGIAITQVDTTNGKWQYIAFLSKMRSNLFPVSC
jgi:hypothetical protein